MPLWPLVLKFSTQRDFSAPPICLELLNHRSELLRRSLRFSCKRVQQYSKTAGLERELEVPTIDSRLGVAGDIQSSVICRDPHFTFSNHRDGTSKTEISEEFHIEQLQILRRFLRFEEPVILRLRRSDSESFHFSPDRPQHSIAFAPQLER